MQFIDTHNHVIPFIDDGAEDWDVSLEMLNQAQADGIVELVCTPHVLTNKDLRDENRFIEKFEDLKVRAKDAGISIKLHIGCELYVQPDFDFSYKLATLAQNGRYFLMEFPMGMIPPFVEQHFFTLFSKKHVPIIAHPERNGGIINDVNKAYELVKKGAMLQVTAGSLLGLFGSQVRTVANQLMDANLVHVIATDAHDVNRRVLKLKRAYELVLEKWGPDRAEMLFWTNPKKIINGEEIDIGEPQSFQSAIHAHPSLQTRLRSFFKMNR
jgi:protein-tyrosine phosphatase